MDIAQSDIGQSLQSLMNCGNVLEDRQRVVDSKVEKIGDKLQNVEFDTIPKVNDLGEPVK